MKRLLLVILFILFSQTIFSKDIELILYKDFLQRLMNKVYPINLSGTSSPAYRVDIDNPILTIQPKYIQVDSVVNITSVLGNQTFPTKCKLIPIYTNNNIELKVIEGKVDLDVLNLGTLELAQYISNIKIPLEINNFKIKDKTIRSQCRNVNFQLFKDRVVVTSEVLIE